METEITESLQHLKELENNPYTLQQIAYWLYEYDGLCKKIKEISQMPCEACREFDKLELPYICTFATHKPKYCTKKYDYFVRHYKKIEQSVRLQELDEPCEEALKEYKQIKGDDLAIKQWLIKYYELGTSDEVFMFELDYINYKEDDGSMPLLVIRDEEIEIYLERKPFSNIILFAGIFCDNFYNKNLYPEKTKEIEEEMKKYFSLSTFSKN